MIKALLDKDRTSVLKTFTGMTVKFPRGSYGYDVLKIGQSGALENLSGKQLFDLGLAQVTPFSNPDRQVYQVAKSGDFDLNDVSSGTVKELGTLIEIPGVVDRLRNELLSQIEGVKNAKQSGGMIWKPSNTEDRYGVHTDADSRTFVDGELATATKRGTPRDWTVRLIVSVTVPGEDGEPDIQRDYLGEKIPLKQSLENFEQMALAVGDHIFDCHAAALAHETAIKTLPDNVEAIRSYRLDLNWPDTMPIEKAPQE